VNLRTLELHTPIQLVVPCVVRIAVMILARICDTVFQPSFFIMLSVLRLILRLGFDITFAWVRVENISGFIT